MLTKSNEWKHLAETVSSLGSDQVDVGNASLQVFVLLYGGKDDDTLGKLRYSSVFNDCICDDDCDSILITLDYHRHTFISSNI